MFKKCFTIIVTMLMIVAVAASCKLPTAEDMRQPDYEGKTQAQVSQEVVNDIASLFDDIRAGDQTGTLSRTFTESQLTALIGEEIGNAPGIPLSNVLINIEEDVMLMAADLQDGDKVRAIVAEFTFEANGETMAMTVGDFTVDNLLASLVPALKQQFVDQLTAGLRSATGPEMVLSAITIPEGATVTDIELVEGALTATGTATAEVLTE